MAKPRLQPGPDHPITITPTGSRVTVTAGGRVVADTTSALTLQEANYPPVQYVPLSDVDPALISATDHQTYCPYKGEASYWSLPEADNAVWGYQDPHDAVAEIKGHVAFYPDKAEVRIADRTAAS
ncbi:hypothetical protein Aph02nite_42410 [Actinoplanes philippinensis]|uniref:Uncharacterized conserved protein, DUF427 family n=1 Tax=Actinoplanes philippinensis TaxID=35752 RepID=A0A1I2H1T8_9ACTN|nr:DUF427 domain-containing protein [Actinoplanes philippinensis]GIE78291.1 hypothetical protein Aph02nite_42410 [Actinoplanes philippinensis]SFF23353.1 Uncharacterized conserved protein, DUF427 family [Actinoplanes philippinensis]